MPDLFPDQIDEASWDEARRRAEAIRAFLRRRGDAATTADVAALAADLGVSQATAYRLIALFRKGGSVTALVERKRGRPVGHRVLDDARDRQVRDTIRAVYLTPNRPPVSELVRQVAINCMAAGLRPPHRRTILARLKDIDLQQRARLRQDKAAAKSTTAVPGALRTARPLEVIQIDHTKADVFVVDEETRRPIGRPWLTLAIDVHSRMVAGFYLTMAAPSRLSTSLCILHAVFDKTAWLHEREIAEPWPVAGLPDTLHVDNGADFRSRAFQRGCEDAGVAITWRPPGEPRFGGHVERLIGTQMGRLHLLPGTTFSNADERGEYDSRRHAALTLRELERSIALDIVGSYHQSIHGGLGRPPLAVWREHEDRTPLRLPDDRQRFWLNFLPEDERTLRPTGIHLFGLRYWSPALSADVGRASRKLLVKYDPRDLSRIFVRRPSGSFVEARYADITLPSLTLHEVTGARKALLAKGRREIGMEAIVRTAVAQRELISEAVRKTAAARRRGMRGQNSRVDDGGWGSLRGVDSSKPVASVEDTD
jgi:putative transposase